MTLGTGTIVAGAAVAAAAYLDGKLQLTKDLVDIFQLKRAEKEWERVPPARFSPWYQFEKQVHTWPAWTRCIWSRHGSYTWRETYAQSCRYAQFFLSHGLKPGEPLAIYLQNGPEFMFTVLGTHAIGTFPAMINNNLTGDALIHCLKTGGSKVLLVDEDVDCQKRVEEMRGRIEQELGVKIIILDQSTKATIAALDPVRPEDKYRGGVTGDSPAFLIYTSGTTGLPKASQFHVQRVWYVGDYRRRLSNQAAGPGGDIFYACLPFYHGTAGVTALGCMVSGIGLAIGRKFSISSFWDDVRDSQSTGLVYVGETARYLLSAPPSSKDRDHKVRLMYGNGLRPDVWKRFQQRFNVPEVMEFFNSTEGVFTLHNYSRNDHFADAVGHHGVVFRALTHKTYIPVRIDHDTGDIYRDATTGFAQRVPYEEGGEILVAVPDENVFKGYWNNPEATSKKYARDVFVKGDLYYRSGDALRRTTDGRWFFMDRLGDTFRWKGENCSTAEVAECLGQFPGVAEANVYGVELPSHDGRACCAAIYISPEDRASFDFTGLRQHAQKVLPKYAIPLFLRLVDVQAPTMHNNKQNKTQLRREGVNPKAVAEGQAGNRDALLWLPPKGQTYERFGDPEWNSIVAGKARF